VVDRKEHEIISKDQRDMDQGAYGENQEMHQNFDVRGAPSPKPGCAMVFFDVNRLSSSRSSHDFPGAGIRKIPKYPGA
jgi:hypothetical protein